MNIYIYIYKCIERKSKKKRGLKLNTLWLIWNPWNFDNVYLLIFSLILRSNFEVDVSLKDTLTHENLMHAWTFISLRTILYGLKWSCLEVFICIYTWVTWCHALHKMKWRILVFYVQFFLSFQNNFLQKLFYH